MGFIEYLGEPLNQTGHHRRRRIRFAVDSCSQVLRRYFLRCLRARSLLATLPSAFALTMTFALALCAQTPFSDYHLTTSGHPRFSRDTLITIGGKNWGVFRGTLASAQESPSETSRAKSVTLLTRQPFGGGAITNISATDTSQLFLTVESPDGISIYKFTPSLNLFEKVLSSTYLESVLDENTDLSSLKIEVSHDGKYLAIYDGNMPGIMVFDLSAYPRIRRTNLGLPKSFVPGGAIFLEGGKFLAFSKGLHFGEGQEPIAVLDLKSGALETLAIQAELAVIVQLKLLPDDLAVVMGYFDPFQKLAETQVGLLSMKDGRFMPWPQPGVLLMDARDGKVGLLLKSTGVSAKKSEAIILDSKSALDSPYQLVVLEKDGAMAPGIPAVPIFLAPKWFALEERKFRATCNRARKQRKNSLVD